MNESLPREIVLIDRNPEMSKAWKRCFADYGQVEVVEGDYFSRPADAMVSPANSFGIMDGGLDRAIRDQLGERVERAVQRVIVEAHYGELAVGQAEVVETGHERWPYLVVAPTMRVPESVARTTHAYLSFRAALLAVARHNAQGRGSRIGSLVCCGLGTGIGGMERGRCAIQMRMALRQLSGPARIPSFDQIHAIHAALVQA